MVTRKNPYSSFVIFLIVLFISSCRPDCNNCKDSPAKGNSDSASTWYTYKTGKFDQSSQFYSQFGAAPFDIAINTGLSGGKILIKPGSKIRFTIHSADNSNIVFTAFMEKKSSDGNAGDAWTFSATNSAGDSVDTGNNCIACHQQQAGNDYLFSVPADKIQKAIGNGSKSATP
jgi:hypothetical protein